MEYVNQLILIIPLALVAIIVLRWIWSTRQRSRGALKIKLEAVPEHDDDFDPLRGELPNGGARIVPPTGEKETGAEEVDEKQQAAPSGEPAADAQGIAVAERVAAPEHEPASPELATSIESMENTGSALLSGPPLPTSTPTPAPTQSTLDLSAPPTEDAPERRGPASGNRMGGAGARDAESPIIIWVVAKGDGFRGSDLLEVFLRNELKYSQKSRVFARLDDHGDERYLVANGVDPGTFNLADMEHELVTPRVVLLLQPSGAGKLQAFEDLCRLARDLAASLGGDLQDDAHGAMSEQTIEHYRQRILELTRRGLSRQAGGS